MAAGKEVPARSRAQFTLAPHDDLLPLGHLVHWVLHAHFTVSGTAIHRWQQTPLGQAGFVRGRLGGMIKVCRSRVRSADEGASSPFSSPRLATCCVARN